MKINVTTVKRRRATRNISLASYANWVTNKITTSYTALAHADNFLRVEQRLWDYCTTSCRDEVVGFHRKNRKIARVQRSNFPIFPMKSSGLAIPIPSVPCGE